MDFFILKTKECKELSDNLQMTICQIFLIYKLLESFGKKLKSLINQVEILSNLIILHKSENPDLTPAAFQKDLDFIESSRTKIEEWMSVFDAMTNYLKKLLERAKAIKQDIELRLAEMEEFEKNLSENC